MDSLDPLMGTYLCNKLMFRAGPECIPDGGRDPGATPVCVQPCGVRGPGYGQVIYNS